MFAAGTCRFCHEVTISDETRYGIRHVAHARCLVDAKGWPWMFANLRDWQVYNAARLVASPVLRDLFS